jgi:hypothetical protein
VQSQSESAPFDFHSACAFKIYYTGDLCPELTTKTKKKPRPEFSEESNCDHHGTRERCIISSDQVWDQSLVQFPEFPDDLVFAAHR